MRYSYMVIFVSRMHEYMLQLFFRLKNQVDFSRDGTLVLTASYDGLVYVGVRPNLTLQAHLGYRNGTVPQNTYWCVAFFFHC